MQLVGVNAVGHRHARNRCTRLPAGFNGALLEFETVGPSGRHIVSAKIRRTPTSVRLTKRRRFSTSVQDGFPRTLTNFPEDTDFLGYLIYDSDSEEFLYKEARTYDKPVRNFSRIPHQAFRFKSFAEAHQQAHKEHGESVVALFDLGAEQLLIAQLSDETAEQSFAVHY